MRNRTEKSAINIAYGFISKILMMFLEFISRYYFIKFLGSELLGVNGVFTNVIQCLSLAELGMNNVVMFSYYKPLAEHDIRKLSALNSFYHKVYNGIAAVVSLVGLCLIPFLKYIINTEVEIPNIVSIYLLFLTDTVVSYLCIYKITVLNADQNSYIATRYDIVLNFIRTISQIISLILFKNFIIYLSIKILYSVIGNFLKARRADTEYSFIRTNETLSPDEKKTIFETIKSGFIYKLSAVLLNSTDNVLISSIVGTTWVGLLSNYITICTAVSSFVTIVYSNLTASVGNLVTTEKAEKKLEIFNVMSLAANWIAFVCFSCTFILCDDFVSLWLGTSYVLDLSIVLPKILMLYVSCVMQPIFSYREALGLYTKTKYVMLLSAIINIILSIVMGKAWGVAGILVASLVAVGSTYFWYEPLVLFRDYFEAPIAPYYKRVFFNILLCSFSTVVLKKLNSVLLFSGWSGLILKGAIIFVIVNIECLVVYGRTVEFNAVTKKILHKLKGVEG